MDQRSGKLPQAISQCAKKLFKRKLRCIFMFDYLLFVILLLTSHYS